MTDHCDMCHLDGGPGSGRSRCLLSDCGFGGILAVGGEAVTLVIVTAEVIAEGERHRFTRQQAVIWTQGWYGS